MLLISSFYTLTCSPGMGKSDVAMETDSDADSGLPDLPDFFADKYFFIYGKMEATQRRLMTRYIIAYGG